MYGSSGLVVAEEAGVRLNSCAEEAEEEEEAICSITRQLVVDPVTNQWRLLRFFSGFV